MRVIHAKTPSLRRAETVYGLYIVKRTQIYLDEDQEASLAKRAATSGVSKSALIREAIDAFLAGPGTREIFLGRFRAALREIELQPVSLPEGTQYVEELRQRDLVRQAELERWRGR